MRVGLYGRVSSEEQVLGYSLDAQERAMRNYCAEKGWEVYGVYVDKGKSARSDDISKRPQFKALIDAALSGQIDVVIVHKLDRFSRNLVTTLTYFQEFSKKGVAFVSLSEQMDYSTAQGNLMLAMMGGFAQWYSDNLAHETSKGKRERAQQGQYNGDLPFGFIKGEDGIAVIEPKEAKAVKRAFSMYVTGRYSFREIAETFNTKGFMTRNKSGRDMHGNITPRPFTADSTRDIVSNPFYTGVVTYKGEEYSGKHEAMIARDLYEQCCQVRRDRSKSPRTNSNRFRTYLLKGLVRCALCGEKLWASTSPFGKYYRDPSKRKGGNCPSDKRYTHVEVLDTQIDELLQSLAMPEAWRIEVLSILKSSDERTQIAKEKERLEEKLRRVKRLYRNMDIEEAEYELEKRKLELQLSTQIVPEEDQTVKAGVMLRNMLSVWSEANIEEKSKMLGIMLDAVYCDLNKGCIVALQPKVAFIPLFGLCEDLKETDGVFTVRRFIGIGDPEGIRTLDLQRDRLAC